eukprot:TRINITY_DN46322_c0_g1_i1.p1 TRINITY_DN46322_c0_g1~~TRINITY_DN46322_c0_g1_i1.p1  ORF type:complete len:144 (+),score=19.68 TRINITY_DN46322_c0_g1_i1:97-528(+)
MDHWSIKIFGHELLTKEGRKPTEEVLAEKRAVLVYFWDRWSPPLGDLEKCYAQYVSSDVEIVFVSSDVGESPSSFQELCETMPWVAFLGSETESSELMSKYNCTGVPFLAVLNGVDGTTVCRNGKSEVQKLKDLEQCLVAWGI